MIVSETQFIRDTKSLGNINLLFERMAGRILEKKMIFISHKHGEEGYVGRLRDLLEIYGFEGYVDWEDDEMPREICGETAIKLKERIIASHKFILIATDEAINSKWCNWEIGFGDAHKYIKHMALLPIKKDNDLYRGEEYLQIYPSIQCGNYYEVMHPEYYIQNPDGKKISLKEWLAI